MTNNKSSFVQTIILFIQLKSIINLLSQGDDINQLNCVIGQNVVIKACLAHPTISFFL